MTMPSLKASMHDSGGGGLTNQARGFSGKDAVKGGCWDEGLRDSWIDIMARPARAKQPAPMETCAERQSDMRREDAEAESAALMCPHDIGGRDEAL